VDVETALPWVQTAMNGWVKELVETYKSEPCRLGQRVMLNVAVDGIRIDTAKHMSQSFLSSFATAAGVYSLGEVYHGDPGYACAYQEQMDGVLNYPLHDLTNRFPCSPAN
jgi:alpha-amylase